jgi:hypothetical protein
LPHVAQVATCSMSRVCMLCLLDCAFATLLGRLATTASWQYLQPEYWQLLVPLAGPALFCSTTRYAVCW